ncbi:agglutinin biogenesis protein MshP [Massilia violaceinigra]|uniref:Agglutinin biogenesis protein MshP n=1 Tax=Massilia violaceinigra TaxID=2045208 RepID=A0A2D2DR84_9BURK|nr:agglutinin biogenesis protein MshP [Massilia violaceinigra]ATQ77494.1 agglutinin biogenesis protein MshP [Massilia violaceinigra]
MKRFPNLERMRGVSLVTAIFLLVVLAGLAVAMVTLATSAQTSSALDLQGTRAYLSARAGAEWGVYQVTRANGACATSTFPMPADSTLARMKVTVICTRTLDTVSKLQRYTVRSTACNTPGTGACPSPTNNIDYVQRVVHVEFSEPGQP